MKSAKKSVIIGVTISVISSILLTTVSAEGLLPTDSGVRLISSTTAVAPMPEITLSQNQLQILITTSNGNASAASNTSSAEKTDITDTYAVANTLPVVVSDIKSTLISNLSIPEVLLSAGKAIADYSAQYTGSRYVYGSASPKVGFDCSGLVYYVYSHFGYSLPRTARAQYSNGTSVDKANLQPGDLVFFATNGGHAITHVGIYIGNNQFIHAATSRQGVITSSLGSAYWAKTLVGAKRIITPQAAVQYVYQAPTFSPV